MGDEEEDDKELHDRQLVITDRSTYLEPSPKPRHTGEPQQPHQPNELYRLESLKLLRLCDYADGVDWHNGREVNEEPSLQVVLCNVPLASFQRITDTGSLNWIHEKELEDHVNQKDEVDDATDEVEEVKLWFEKADLDWGTKGDKEQRSDSHHVPLLKEAALVGVDDPRRILRPEDLHNSIQLRHKDAVCRLRLRPRDGERGCAGPGLLLGSFPDLLANSIDVGRNGLTDIHRGRLGNHLVLIGVLKSFDIEA
mmetsp:Transcript_112360/g.357070  ORF Transcript_112360/g.357070 Transcript_112360/m.357070 type:complete len:253 (+) Transcript_112360:1024-1782(+)